MAREITSIELSEGASWVLALGMRYANTRGLTELMANACNLHEPYSELVRDCLQRVNKTAEVAMAQSLGGDPGGAVQGPSWDKTASGTPAAWHCGCAAAATTHRHASHRLRKTAWQ